MADVAAHDHKHVHDEKHVVRFPEEQDDKCNKISVLRTGGSNNKVEIHAGFFKSDHKYEVIFEINDFVGLGKDVSIEAPSGAHMTSTNVQHNTSGNIEVTLEYFPQNIDGIINECFTIRSNNGNKELHGVLRAEVLGHGQGTPMLKDGVRCIQRPHSASSSTSS
uniref:UPF0687 protein C20orf27 homolog n=1 Tax=Styela clava TaxID=7725 RepID=UPI0019396E6F|nr:UPF0687 protein C20orf27 homolog [Styela clava]